MIRRDNIIFNAFLFIRLLAGNITPTNKQYIKLYISFNLFIYYYPEKCTYNP